MYPPISILKETEDWFIVAKPPTLLTHGHPRFPKEVSLIERLQLQCDQKLFIVHRLDRGASGCLLIAKRSQWVSTLKESLSRGRKSYLALVRGVYRGSSPYLIDKAMKVNGVFKEARSEIIFLASQDEPRSSLLLVHPHTGRYHQVRRHVRDTTHPILGDSEHGDSKINRWWRVEMGLQRLALHALAIDIDICEEVVYCPLFEDQKALFSRLQLWPAAKMRLENIFSCSFL